MYLQFSLNPIYFIIADSRCTGFNEEYVDCYRNNNQFCKNGILKPTPAPTQISHGAVIGCAPGCRCVSGTMRNNEGVCVPDYYCQSNPYGILIGELKHDKSARHAEHKGTKVRSGGHL